MARNEYKGERLHLTLDKDVYKIIEDDAAFNGIPTTTRAKQLLTLKAREIEASKNSPTENSNNTSNNSPIQNDNQIGMTSKFKIKE